MLFRKFHCAGGGHNVCFLYRTLLYILILLPNSKTLPSVAVCQRDHGSQTPVRGACEIALESAPGFCNLETLSLPFLPAPLSPPRELPSQARWAAAAAAEEDLRPL